MTPRQAETFAILGAVEVILGVLVLLATLLVLGQVVKIYTEVLKMRALTQGDRWDGKDKK